MYFIVKEYGKKMFGKTVRQYMGKIYFKKDLKSLTSASTS